MFDGTICSVSDVGAAAAQLGGKFELEKCGFFSKCTHAVEKFDVTTPAGGYVEILFCEIDWMKAGPLLVACLVFAWFVWRKMRALDFRRQHSEEPRPSPHYGAPRHHHHRRY